MRDLKINPLDTNILFVSHDHPDHYTDAEIIVEAMTRGMTKRRGHIVSSVSVLEGFGKYENAISKYHQSMCEGVHILNPGESVSLYDVELTGTRTKHGDPFGIGLRVSTYNGDIGYTGDTEKIDSLSQDFDGVRVLVANVMRERGRRIRGHLCSDDLIDLLESMNNKPELVIMNHMGLKMTNVIGECRYILDRTGVKTIAGKIGLKVSLYRDFYSIVYL